MKLSTDKRNKLIAVGIATAVVLGLIWFFIVGAQQAKLRDLREHYLGEIEKQRKMKNVTSEVKKIEENLKEAEHTLSVAEQQMASGDLYSWLYTTIKTFKTSYRVDIPQFGNAETANTTLLYNFPYRQVKTSVAGTGYFHDFGKFLADFENRFPLIRVENLVLEPVPGASEADREKLLFKMDVVALINAPVEIADKK